MTFRLPWMKASARCINVNSHKTMKLNEIMKIKCILHSNFRSTVKVVSRIWTDLFSKSSRFISTKEELNFLHVFVQLWVIHIYIISDRWCSYLYRRDNTLLRERRSSGSPARHTRLGNRRTLLLDTDTSSTSPCDTPRPPQTPARHEHTAETLQHNINSSGWIYV